MNNAILPNECMMKLKCVLCKGLLSVPPISGSKGKYKCGRCEPSRPTNDLYEEIARHINFPCINENCKEVLSWGSVKDHENICKYKNMKCPYPECKMKFQIRILPSHFEIHHMEWKYDKTVTSNSIRLIEVTSATPKVYCILLKDHVFIAVATIGQKQGNTMMLRYYCGFSVYSLNDCPKNIGYKVQVHLLSTKENTILIKDKQEIEKYTDFDFDIVDEMTHNTVFRNLDGKDGMTLKYTIEVYNTDDEHIAETKKETINVGLVATLECPICTEYMSAPIYICSKGHSLCSTCKSAVHECPYCKSAMTNGRNFALEAIAEKTRIPCSNASEGCSFVGEIHKMKLHEENCHF